MAKIDTILVVGGGLAGLTTAAALRQHGFTVELVERRETWHAVGAGFRPRCSRAPMRCWNNARGFSLLQCSDVSCGSQAAVRESFPVFRITSDSGRIVATRKSAASCHQRKFDRGLTTTFQVNFRVTPHVPGHNVADSDGSTPG